MMKPEKRHTGHSQSHSIAFSGVTIAVVLLCLVLFRGVLSIVQAMIIPVAIVLLSFRQPLMYIIATGISLLVLTMIFFPVQLLFILTYIIMAIFLLKVDHDSKRQPIRKWGFRILYFLLIGLMLFIGIIMTDKVFGTHLNAMMNQLSQDRYLIYVMIIMLEALVVSTIHITSLLMIRRRVSTIFN